MYISDAIGFTVAGLFGISIALNIILGLRVYFDARS
jgi:hypothetical protein